MHYDRFIDKILLGFLKYNDTEGAVVLFNMITLNETTSSFAVSIESRSETSAND
jgi:hypothetical protein